MVMVFQLNRKSGLLMKKLIRLLILQTALFCAAFTQTSTPQNVEVTWKEASYALKQNQLDKALHLYQQVLHHSRQTNYMTGQANALEAIALVTKKQEKYSLTEKYCRESIETGRQTFRSYYMLAQVAFEHQNDIRKASGYCQEGLARFPGNESLKYYQSYISGPIEHKTTLSHSANQSATHFKGITAKDSLRYLTSMEKEVIAEMNFARTRPREFAKHLEALAKYYDGKLIKIPGEVPVMTQEGVSAVQEAIRYLKKIEPAGELYPSKGLSLAAKDHVKDQSESGDTGHTGRDGSQPHERIERHGKWRGLSGENIAYGDHNPRMIVMQLIIDDGVPDRGHRKNIFAQRFRVTGVAIGTHTVYRTMCVITYAGGFEDR